MIELLSDRAFALAPFGLRQARRMIDRLACRKLLDGLRGAAPADLDALCQALANFSLLCASLAGHIREFDVNPLIVGACGVQAVDALLVSTGRC